MASLRREVARFEMGRPPEDERPISTGSPTLDRLLPVGGLRRGTLVEYLTPVAGSGAATLALSAAREACRAGRPLVAIDQPPSASNPRAENLSYFYPPAAAAWGIDLTAMLVLRPASAADALWACDQALRCPGVAAVWAAWDRLDVRDFRRLQLAAECGGTLGLILRPARHRGQPTWADVQWHVKPAPGGRETQRSPPPPSLTKRHFGRGSPLHSPWRLQVELVRCHGVAGGQIAYLELDEVSRSWREDSHATLALPLSAPVAHSTAARRA